MARIYSGKRPRDLRHTLGTFSRYLGRHRILIALVGVLAAVSALANLLGTYMIRPIVNQFVGRGDTAGLVAGVAVTAGIYAVGALPDYGPGGPKGAAGHPGGPVPPASDPAPGLL